MVQKLILNKFQISSLDSCSTSVTGPERQLRVSRPTWTPAWNFWSTPRSVLSAELPIAVNGSVPPGCSGQAPRGQPPLLTPASPGKASKSHGVHPHNVSRAEPLVTSSCLHPQSALRDDRWSSARVSLLLRLPSQSILSLLQWLLPSPDKRQKLPGASQGPQFPVPILSASFLWFWPSPPCGVAGRRRGQGGRPPPPYEWPWAQV